MNTIKQLRHEVTKIANDNYISNIWIEISTNLVNDCEHYAIYHRQDWDKHNIIEADNTNDLLINFKEYATKNRN